ncbi:MAG TPA: hypothetical protein VK671_01365, partial [Mucilaginibacter sp.]|nr:hypothetical protein [Mucilaginibacter sp.]
EHKYTFNVLMDEKGEDGEQTRVKNIYNVGGLPTKFVIDKNGFIRFKYLGYRGTPEGLVDDITNMIEMASNPEAVASSQRR